MNFIIIPLYLFPAPALIILGIAKDGGFRLAFGFLILCFSACGSSIAITVYYRYCAVPCLIGILLGYLSQPMNPDQWWDFFVNNFPRDDVGNYMLYCLDTSTYEEHNTYNLCSFDGLVLGYWNANIFFASILIEFLIYVFIVFGGSFYVYCCLKRKTNQMTNKDYSHERKLIVALFVQAFVPFICLALPYIVSMVLIFFDIKGPQILTDILFQISTLHSFFNTLSMILLIKPYREATLHLMYFQYAHTRVTPLLNANAKQLLTVNVAATVRRLELNDTVGNQNVQQTTRNVIITRSNL